MPETIKLDKALLIELEEDLVTEKPGGKRVEVQFNPETLKLSFSNQIDTQAGAGVGDNSSGSSGRQFVGSGTTKLSFQLWFDVTAIPGEGKKVDDVRKFTQEVVYFMTAIPSKKNPKNVIPPGISFRWGSFTFDGLMDSLEEAIEYFSNEGKPLRSSLSINLSQKKILVVKFEDSAQPGTRPLSQATQGATLQGMAAAMGKADNWKEIAAANNIENPRLLKAGQFIDLNVKLPGKS